jgi:ubiquinone/menaquinone biosynthesis C-methylase UbiE
MQSIEDIRSCYLVTAADYAQKTQGELSKKHLDTILLKAFAEANKDTGLMADFGCGPGHITQFLFDQGVRNILGVDLSPEMLREAKSYHPDLDFEEGNLLALQYKDEHFRSAVAFYSLVHFVKEQMKTALREIYRVLAPSGEFLFCFHIGNDKLHYDTWFGHPVSIDIHYHSLDEITSMTKDIGFTIVDAIVRDPYLNIEHPCQRGYIWAKKT